MPKASRSSKSIETKGCTPTGLRRFFFKLELLGKRRHSDLFFDYSTLDPVVDTPPPKKAAHQAPAELSSGQGNLPPTPAPTPSSPTPPKASPPDTWPRAERVALVNEDYAENAVIITTFDDIPFCCHEDLLTMSHDQLIGVALAFNAKLPAALAIDIDHALPTSFIRASIERLVGLRQDVPQAPKALRLLADAAADMRLRADDFDMRNEMDKTPPTSPLASRSRQFTSLISPRLARLQEEEEEEFDIDHAAADRLLKKRKLSFDNAGTDAESAKDDDSDVDMLGPAQTPTPLPRLHRARSQHLAPVASPIAPRVLRSHSQKLGKTAAAIDMSFVNTKRPAYRYQRKPKRAAVEARNDEVEVVAKPIGIRRTGRLRPIAGHRGLAPTTGESGNGRAVTSSISSRMKENGIVSPAVSGRKRKRNFDRTEAEKQMTSGIGRMSVGQCKDSDEMDVSP
ncbi:hypothetical protein LshimejAT787_0900780 [Lyophyllum shimeji]|uniref:Uncharacterized protein n=1 Tax=Lyophyllum shimeji TaxID=47721 RepID=A0A9P3PSN6_LYOSH|nr:hypothetical protein LshimejAT787_0900780 [Lyophyllum shimeji]